jgi:LacI family transcriptional regulator
LTIRQVARRAGVSVSSVSRVLNGHPDISEAMRQKVLSATAELGYQPDSIARGLRSGATSTIGFSIRDITNSLFGEMVKGAEWLLQSRGYSILLMNSLENPELDARNIAALRRRRVDGLILSLQSERHEGTRRELLSFQKPVVLLDREVSGVAAGAVMCDHYAGVYPAVRDQIAKGRSRLALICGPEDIRATRERLRAFQSAHADAGLKPVPRLVRLGSYTRDYGYEAALDLLASRARPAGIICGGSQIGTGVIAALRSQGLSTREVPLVICDTSEAMALLDPGIGTINRDAESMGRLAAELILEALQRGDPTPASVSVPTNYVPATADPAATPLPERIPAPAAP